MNQRQTQFFKHCALIGGLLSVSPAAFALGLGNIDLQSHLGEPLRATIKLVGVPKSMDAGCFRLLRSSDNYPASTLNANILLREDSAGNTSLLINSYQALEDPIVQLTLVAECENQLSREYVLLLDPPFMSQSDTNDTTFEALPATTPSSEPMLVAPMPQTEESNSAKVKPEPQTIPIAPSKPRVKPKALAANTSSAKRNNEDTLPSQSPGNQSGGNPETGQPRLVVSGGDYIRPDFFDTPLQLQMSLSLEERAVDTTMPLSAEEVSDEVTAMSNRLAHLESQILALQKRNLELEASQADAALLPIETTDPTWLSWMLYTFGTVLLIILIGLAEWVRRRHGQKQLATEVAIWEELATSERMPILRTGDEALMPDTSAQPLQQTAGSRATGGGKSSSMPQQAIQQPFSSHANSEGIVATVNEDILEQADVFVAHGRANLAIVLLQDHLKDFPGLAPAPWLMLLDLLKREGDRESYVAATEECRQHFNVAIEDFDSPIIDDTSSIEDFPRIREQLEQLWGTAELTPFLDDLIYNRRLEARQGFGRNVYMEILLLRSIAHDLNFITSAQTKAPVIPIHGKKSEAPAESAFEKTAILPVSIATPMVVEKRSTEIDSDTLRARPSNDESEEIVLDAPTLSPATSDDTLFENLFDTPDLPSDKSAPLDFEIEFKTKK